MSALAKIKENLASGKYKDIGGARKGVGKSKDLTAEEKAQAYKLVEKHFGADGGAKAAPKKAAKGAAKKPGRKPGRKPKAEAAPAAAAPVHGRKKKATKKVAAKPQRAKSTLEEEVVDDLTAGINDARDNLRVLNDSMKVATDAANSTGIDVKPLLNLISEKMSGVIANMQGVNRDIKTAAAGLGGNGTSPAHEPGVAMPASQPLTLPVNLPGVPSR
jgi:hypothetical protein